MTRLFLLLGILPCCIHLFAQNAEAGLISPNRDAEAILKASFAKCGAVRNGYMEAKRYKTFPGNKDTIYNFEQSYIKKVAGDSLSPALYHVRFSHIGHPAVDLIYTGNEMIRLIGYDSSGEIFEKKRWADDIKKLNVYESLYSPITNNAHYPIPYETQTEPHHFVFKSEGEDSLNGYACYRLQINEIPIYDSTADFHHLNIEYHYWINKADSMPVQLTDVYDNVMNNDTMHFYEKIMLTKYDFNTLSIPDEKQFTLASIPPRYTLKDHVPHKRPDLLAKDTTAPDWTLSSLQGEKVSLAGLKGKVVLIDFFYRTCYPCMQALPTLEALHEKYKDRGLRIIGIDPFDKKDDDIEGFLRKRGVTYTILLDDINTPKNTAMDYHVAGFPTLYLIDKSGKIVSVTVGYGPDVEKSLDKDIQEHL